MMSQGAHAGLYGFTMHSRANCANNESIAWHWLHPRYLLTISDHIHQNKGTHRVATPWEDTWRSAAVHWGEAFPGAGWVVRGEHWESRDHVVATRIGFEEVRDCSIYDGWWDK